MPKNENEKKCFYFNVQRTPFREKDNILIPSPAHTQNFHWIKFVLSALQLCHCETCMKSLHTRAEEEERKSEQRATGIIFKSLVSYNLISILSAGYSIYKKKNLHFVMNVYHTVTSLIWNVKYLIWKSIFNKLILNRLTSLASHSHTDLDSRFVRSIFYYDESVSTFNVITHSCVIVV